MEDTESVTSPLETARAVVQDLYGFRDHYFENFPLARAKHKTEDLTEKLTDCLHKLDDLKDTVQNKSEYFLLRGKALNVLPNHSQEAQDLLCKSVKLDPKLVEAWIQLGEVYWKNKDVDDAKNCFVGALNHSKDKVALRNLSMVLRQLGETPEERNKLIQESVKKAKAAVQLDIKDGTSWFILGNAYLSMFFASGQTLQVLKQCTSAYQQAERDPISKNNPDLHFNRSMVYKYQEDYKSALEGYAQAAALDPLWTEPQTREKQMTDYLNRTIELINTKGKIKAKKLTNLVESLKDSDLGPYSDGSYTGPNGTTVKLEQVLLDDLVPELNKERVVVGKVVCSLITEDPVPFTFCMVDRTSTCYSVTVYNIATAYGVKIGDSVAIPEPFLVPVDFNYKDQSFQFKNVRVDSPVILVVNGRKQGIDKQAPSVLTVSAMSE